MKKRTVRIGATIFVVCTIALVLPSLQTVFSAEIFADAFESGSYAAWNGVKVSAGETASISSAMVHHGTYSANFASNGNGGTEYAYCLKNLAPCDELYARGYFKVTDSGIVDNEDRGYFIVFRAGSNNVAYAGWRRTAGAIKWTLIVRHETGYVSTYSSTSPSLNIWYCVELHWLKNATNGYGELWVDGSLACSISGKNTAYYGSANQTKFGLAELVNCNKTAVYMDCTAISSTYIGPEANDEWFSNVTYVVHTDPEYGSNSLEVIMDIDTTAGTLSVAVYAFFYYTDEFGIQRWEYYENPMVWTITGTSDEYYSFTFYPAIVETSWDVELILYDAQGNFEDYRYDYNVAYLIPGPE